jgi:hypothetical protein
MQTIKPFKVFFACQITSEHLRFTVAEHAAYIHACHVKKDSTLWAALRRSASIARFQIPEQRLNGGLIACTLVLPDLTDLELVFLTVMFRTRV